jgi:hypothetical protein
LFGDDKTWTKTGGKDCQNLGENLKKHEAHYLKNMNDLTLLLAVKNTSQLGEAYRKQKNEYNEKKTRNSLKIY